MICCIAEPLPPKGKAECKSPQGRVRPGKDSRELMEKNIPSGWHGEGGDLPPVKEMVLEEY